MESDTLNPNLYVESTPFVCVFVCLCCDSYALRIYTALLAIMSARRKHVRAHARDVEVEVDGETDLVCRVEEIKGGNVIEV